MAGGTVSVTELPSLPEGGAPPVSVADEPKKTRAPSTGLPSSSRSVPRMVPAVGFSWANSCACNEIGSAIRTNNNPTDRERRTSKPDQSNKVPLSWGQNLKENRQRFRV